MTSFDATQSWDVIIIGAGMGGGMASRRLAELGLRVLIIEKGGSGHRNEQQSLNNKLVSPLARQIRGLWPKPVAATVDQRTSHFFAPIGSGVGGSSVFYAGALERPERHDLEDTPDMPHPTGGWPVGYDAFLPYFSQAEALLHISGTPDPLSSETVPDLADPLPLSAGEDAMMQDMAARGLSPYRLHLAIRNLPGCLICLGHKCPRVCKMDGRSAGIEPALETGNAQLVSGADVTELLHDESRITGVAVTYNGANIVLQSKTYVLAAGALGSARLMLMSQGCGNSSDWVGRGLMFHVNEIFALWPRRSQQFEGASKAISLRDLYAMDGQRFGMVQSMGLEASYGNIAYYLVGLYERSILRRFRRLKPLLTIIPALIAARILGQAKVFVGILEDLPYPENRVMLNPSETDKLSFKYTISKELQQRRSKFRRQIKRAFSGYRTLLMGQQVELNYGHPCGTLRFGTNPATSVLDATCKAHDLDNLYVVDASIFPTSMGVNPSLTIAANALRVADIIAKHHSVKDR